MVSSRIHIVRILLVTVTLALGSLYGYYEGREWLAKWAFAHQTAFGIDELILITIPQADLSTRNAYLISAGEFDWQGEMVDVLHREIRADTLYVYGFRDEAETELKQEAAWLYEDASQSNKLPDANTKRAKWFSPFVLPDRVVLPLVAGCHIADIQRFVPYFSFFIQRPLLEVPSPPPDL